MSETKARIANKLARRAFTATCFLADLVEIGCQVVRIEDFIIQTFKDFLERKKLKNSAGDTRYSQSPTDGRKPDPFSFYPNEGEKNRHEHRHRVQEKLYWTAYIVISFFTLVAAASAAFYARGAYNAAIDQAASAKTQASQSVEQTRISKASQLPYLFVENVSDNGRYWHIGLPDPETNFPSGTHLKWIIHFNNLGSTPAIIEAIKGAIVVAQRQPSLKANEVVGIATDEFPGRTDYIEQSVPIGTVIQSSKSGPAYTFIEPFLHKPRIDPALSAENERWQRLQQMIVNPTEPPKKDLSNSARAYLIGRVDYLDVFGAHHNIGFGFELYIPSERITLIQTQGYNYRDQPDDDEKSR